MTQPIAIGHIITLNIFINPFLRRACMQWTLDTFWKLFVRVFKLFLPPLRLDCLHHLVPSVINCLVDGLLSPLLLHHLLLSDGTLPLQKDISLLSRRIIQDRSADNTLDLLQYCNLSAQNIFHLSFKICFLLVKFFPCFLLLLFGVLEDIVFLCQLFCETVNKFL